MSQTIKLNKGFNINLAGKAENRISETDQPETFALKPAEFNHMTMAKMLVNEFKEIAPSDIEELQKLPGVGRKTANVVASVVYNQPRMAVDTHVFRVSERLGLTYRAKNPLQAELQLIKYIPEDSWLNYYVGFVRRENVIIVHLHSSD